MIDRRGALRLGVLGLTLLGTSRGVARLAAGSPPARPADPTGFAEVYKGRRIRGTAESRHLTSDQAGRPVGTDAGPAGSPRVFIDEVELHLMPAGVGGYTTAMNHYQTFASPRLAARAAVDGLYGADLLPIHR